MLLNCPSQEKLFESVSIARELSLWERARVRSHTWHCSGCREKKKALSQTWQSYLSPEPEVTSSLMKVYSRLQKDETLILKGWKLTEVSRPHSLSHWLLKEGWLFRGGISLGAFGLVVALVVSQMSSEEPSLKVASVMKPPMAQIRIENGNTVKVHYVQPELLQSMEFETTSER